MKYLIYLLLPGFFMISCGSSEELSPKPRTFPKLELPEENRIQADALPCPFEFDVLEFCKIDTDGVYPKLGGEENPDCWFNIQYPDLNATIHFSYVHIQDEKHFDKLVSGTYKIANHINLRSDYMDELPISKGDSMSGMLFDFEGPAASPMQFLLTDSSKHFMRSSLYINARIDVDSLAPIIDFLERDVQHIIGSFEWNE